MKNASKTQMEGGFQSIVLGSRRTPPRIKPAKPLKKGPTGHLRAKRRQEAAPRNIPLDRELLGHFGRHTLTYSPRDKEFQVLFNGDVKFSGKIEANNRGIDTLKLESQDGELEPGKFAQGYLDIERREIVIHGHNIAIPVNPFHLSLTRLADAHAATARLASQEREELMTRAKESLIVCSFTYQVTDCFILQHPPTKKFILATRNYIADPHEQWEFFDGRISEKDGQVFLRFSETSEWGISSLLASAYIAGANMLIEFGYKNPIRAELKSPHAAYLAPLRRNQKHKAEGACAKMAKSHEIEVDQFDDDDGGLTEEDLARLRGEKPIERAPEKKPAKRFFSWRFAA